MVAGPAAASARPAIAVHPPARCRPPAARALLVWQIEAIYHTSIVVGGMEHYFGGGINVARAGSTPFGQPMEVLDLG